MIDQDIQETRDLQKLTDDTLRDFKQDMEEAVQEMDKIEKRDRRWQLILSFYFGVVFTVLVEAIALLINKGLHG